MPVRQLPRGRHGLLRPREAPAPLRKPHERRDFVGPDATLDVSAEIEHEGSGYAVTKASISSGGKRIADAGLRFRIMPFPAELGHLMIARARAIGLDT